MEMEQIYVVLEADSFDDLCAVIFLSKGYTPYGGVVVRGTTFSQVLLRSDAQKTQEILFAELLGLGHSCPKPRPIPG